MHKWLDGLLERTAITACFWGCFTIGAMFSVNRIEPFTWRGTCYMIAALWFGATGLGALKRWWMKEGIGHAP